jgi:hypothetical protein
MATPFALLVEAPAAPADRTPSFTYDRQHQVNVTSSGKPVIDITTPYAETFTHNSSGWKKDDDFASAPSMLFGPTMTHNSSGLKKDDD